ncbi:MAG: ATP-binding protein [Terriglobia bacterium]
MEGLKWMPVIDVEACTGCGLCVEACGPRSLDIVDGKAVLARPDTCGSEEHCIEPCRDDAIHMAWVPMRGDGTRGRWASSWEGKDASEASGETSL